MIIARVDVAAHERVPFLERTARLVAVSRQEPGVLAFDLYEVREGPGTFVFSEIFTSTAAALAHRRAPHTQAWFDAVPPRLSAPPEITRLRPVDLKGTLP